MADWRKVALAAVLADGKVDDAEVKVLRRELWSDGVIDQEEVEFLIDLRIAAQKKAKAKKETLTTSFENLFYKAIQENVLKDGRISAAEAGWLRTTLYSDKKIDEGEKKFLTKLKKAAKETSPEFDQLCADALGEEAAKPAPKKKAPSKDKKKK